MVNRSKVTLWPSNITETIPKVYNASRMGFDRTDVISIFYKGLNYKGMETRVFAYYGIPKMKNEKKVPGVVLVHGGNGTASDDWVRKWVAKGYAAIAMDLEGHTPDFQTHKWSGPRRKGVFDDINMPVEDQWTYHAVANVIVANNILRSLPNVDCTRIGIIGISWGGVITGIVLGVDERFKFAVPIYGCGYLNEAETYFGSEMTSGKMQWDPSRFFVNSNIPILWVNGNSDPHFPISISMKSYRSTLRTSCLSIHHQMPHNMNEGMRPSEIYRFADNVFNNGVGMGKIIEHNYDGIGGFVSYSKPILRAELYYITSSLAYNDRTLTCDWIKQELVFITESKLEYTVPADAKMHYINLIDEEDLITTVV